jgi:hypothetical protein
MSRVESASGARYSAHNEQARKFEPIAPVGTNYTPVGKVDIAAMRSAAPPAAPRSAVPSSSYSSAGIPAAPTPSGPTFRTTSVGSAATAARVPMGTWDAPKPTVSAASPPPPAAPRPPPTVVATPRSVPAHSATVPSSDVPTKPSEDDRIGPVVSFTRSNRLPCSPLGLIQGTAYTPVSLPPPKRLNNPFEARAQAALSAQSVPLPRPAGASTGRMTWSERQALAKKRAEEDEATSRAAAAPAPSRPAASAGRWGAAAVGGAATSVAAAVGVADVSWEPEPEAAPDEEPVVREFL